MLRHIFKYRMKIHLRQRPELFWTLVYPILLAVFFSMAFANLQKAEVFASFPIAVVDNEEYKAQPYFIQALKSVSDGAATEKDHLFNVRYTTREQATADLADNAIKGYIYFDGGAHVVVKASGLDQTILKSFMDSYLQQTAAVTDIIKSHNGSSLNLQGGSGATYIKQAENETKDQTMVMFYGLLSMAVMFGGYWGRREVVDVQANMSAQGARMSMSPVHKLKAFLFSLSTSVLIHIASLLILVAFMTLVLGVNFGNQLGSVLLVCAVAGLMGVTFGAFVAALIPGSENARNAVLLSVSLLSSTLAGMVSPTLKYLVTEAVPPLQYINPANLVSDALYALYYYGPGQRYTLNLLLMLVFSAVFALGVYLVTRRQKYASL